MFDLRYHVASLAAVFIALAVGIVIGVAIASGGSVEDATKSFREQQIRSLEQQLEAAGARADLSEDQRQAVEDLMKEVYPELMADRLAGRRLAVLFIGPIDGEVRAAVERTLTDTGARGAERIAALELPIDAETIDRLLAQDPATAAYRGDARLPDVGEALGLELLDGGATPLWDALASELVEERTGALELPVDGIVVVRSWVPPETDDPVEQGRANETAALVTGLLRGLDGRGRPVVGVETSTVEVSAVDVYRDLGISTVDDVDTLAGRIALGLLLAGAEPGHYGTKSSATDGVSPPIEPLTVAPVGG